MIDELLHEETHTSMIRSYNGLPGAARPQHLGS
jgi:hypothetical protein